MIDRAGIIEECRHVAQGQICFGDHRCNHDEPNDHPQTVVWSPNTDYGRGREDAAKAIAALKQIRAIAAVPPAPSLEHQAQEIANREPMSYHADGCPYLISDRQSPCRCSCYDFALTRLRKSIPPAPPSSPEREKVLEALKDTTRLARLALEDCRPWEPEFKSIADAEAIIAALEGK